MRWENEATVAAELLGWTVVESDGVNDYQGWGVLLLKRFDVEWGTLAWSYGSCNHCDSYEDKFGYGMADEDFNQMCVQEFGPLIESADDEEKARARFSERKGW